MGSSDWKKKCSYKVPGAFVKRLSVTFEGKLVRCQGDLGIQHQTQQGAVSLGPAGGQEGSGRLSFPPGMSPLQRKAAQLGPCCHSYSKWVSLKAQGVITALIMISSSERHEFALLLSTDDTGNALLWSCCQCSRAHSISSSTAEARHLIGLSNLHAMRSRTHNRNMAARS